MPKGAPKGHQKWGGRQKGTPNKKTTDLQKKATEMGVDPYEVLLLFTAGRHLELGYDEPIDPSVRSKCAAEACSYLYPKRKAVELSEDPEKPLGQAAAQAIDLLERIKNLKGE